jgi:hypothetical protein
MTLTEETTEEWKVSVVYLTTPSVTQTTYDAEKM